MAAATALAAVSCVNKINDYDAERIISFKALRPIPQRVLPQRLLQKRALPQIVLQTPKRRGLSKSGAMHFRRIRIGRTISRGRKRCWKAKTTSTPTESGKALKITCGVQGMRE